MWSQSEAPPDEAALTNLSFKHSCFRLCLEAFSCSLLFFPSFVARHLKKSSLSLWNARVVRQFTLMNFRPKGQRASARTILVRAARTFCQTFVVVRTFASATYFYIRMVDVIGASSLRRAIDKAPTSIRKSIQGKVSGPGLSFTIQLKALPNNFNIYSKNGLKGWKKIVIWHDLLNNSLSSHRRNRNRNCSLDVFFLEPCRNQISAIIYNQKIRTPNIHKKLVQAWYITINPKRYLLSNRKKISGIQSRIVENASTGTH